MSKFLFTALFLVSIASFGQDYVITQKSDTLKGEVRVLSYDLLDRIQIAQGKKKTTYTALQVRRISINGEQFIAVKYENSVRLMKVIRAGFLSLYAHRASGQAGYDTRILQKIGEKAMEVPNLGFRKYIGGLVADCPTVSDKVKNGDLDRGNIEELVDQYNLCIDESNKLRMENAGESKTPVAELVDQMKLKITASDITNKSDVNDLLNSIADRYKKKEPVPAYMKEGLKGYLGTREDLNADMEKLFTLIDK